MMHFATIEIKKKKSIAHIILNRPEKRNAMNGQMIQDLLQALKNILSDHSIRILMITGKGTHFCSGADIAWMQKIAISSQEENKKDANQLAQLLKILRHFPIPTIAAIQGSALGGGLGLIACCDIAIAADNAQFCFSEVKIGLTPSVISPYIISSIGERAARYYFLTAEKIDAKEARQIGLIHRIVSEEVLLENSIALANELLQYSPQALRETKSLIDQVSWQKINEDTILLTINHLSHMRATDEAQEGLNAFLEKRESRWSS